MKKADPTAPSAKDFNKRRSVEAGLKLADAAHVATWRLYCEVLALWRDCRMKKCRRHRRCLGGTPAACLLRAQPIVPPTRLMQAEKEVMAGGPRRIPPATHLEWIVRRQPLPSLTRWRMTSGASQ